MVSHESQVLCAVTADGRAAAVAATARRLIATGRYRVHYLHATDLPARTVPAYVGTVPAPTPGYPPELMVREAEEAGDALFRQLGIDVGSSTVKIVHGDPVEELRRRADELEPDFLVLGNRRHGSLTRLILGSVTQAMATQGRWPLLLVSEVDDHAAQGPVICGVAASGEEVSRTVDVATRFARQLGKPLVLAHVRDDDSSALAIDARAFPAAPGGVVPLASPPSPNGDPATTLREIVDTLGGEDMEFVLLDGSPPTALADLAEEVDAEAIVVGSREVSGLRSVIDGSVSLDLIRNAARPVMIVPRLGRG